MGRSCDRLGEEGRFRYATLKQDIDEHACRLGCASSEWRQIRSSRRAAGAAFLEVTEKEPSKPRLGEAPTGAARRTAPEMTT